MPETNLFVVDAFTDGPLLGNPAGVLVVDREISLESMLRIAAEMKHSETAFVVPKLGSAGQSTRFGLRWCTPEVEVPLCGHATLASAAVIFLEFGNDSPVITFETRSGALLARRSGRKFQLDFPVETLSPTTPRPRTASALGLREVKEWTSARSDRNLLLEVGDEDEVRRLCPDYAALVEARGADNHLGVIVTARASPPYDFVSRYFAPWVGVDEDPVTGSTHCALAPYWASRLGRTELRALQASPRGGSMDLVLRGSRVELTGSATIFLSGNLRVPTHPEALGEGCGPTSQSSL